MAGGELAAVCKGLAEDADQAAGNIAESVAKIGEQTPDDEEANLGRTLENEARDRRPRQPVLANPASAQAPAMTNPPVADRPRKAMTARKPAARTRWTSCRDSS